MGGCTTTNESGSLVLHVHPSTFTTNIGAVEDAFVSLGYSDDFREVVLDMSDTFRLDSRGLRTLVDLQKRLQDRGGSLVLLNVPAALRRLLEYARLDRYFVLRTAGGPSASASRASA